MQRILPYMHLLNKIVSDQKTKALKYRLNSFVLSVSCADGILLYHNMTGELLLLSEKEWKEIKEFTESDNLYYIDRGSDDCISETDSNKQLITELIRQWYLVPEDFDEYSMCLQVINVASLLKPKSEGITNFTIFTTTDCNARCFYCYELGRPRRSMSRDTALDVASYISKVSQGQAAKISWFGGEPLYNSDAINVICDALRSSGIDYSSKMVSNGYLFDPEMVQAAVKKWNLTGIQISLDGTEEVYNRTKAYIYEDVNAYEHVLENIGLLMDAGIKVVIRLNLNRENAGDIWKLSDEIAERFAIKKPEVYVVLLKDFGHDARQFEDDEEGIAAFEKIERHLIELGINQTKKLHRVLHLNRCMADNDHGVTILPDGRIGKCEHESEDKLIGTIYDGQLDQDMIDAWKERIRITDCKICVFMPSCIKLRLCAWNNDGCTETDRKLMRSNLNMTILNEYNKWLTNGEKQE